MLNIDDKLNVTKWIFNKLVTKFEEIKSKQTFKWSLASGVTQVYLTILEVTVWNPDKSNLLPPIEKENRWNKIEPVVIGTHPKKRYKGKFLLFTCENQFYYSGIK